MKMYNNIIRYEKSRNTYVEVKSILGNSKNLWDIFVFKGGLLLTEIGLREKKSKEGEKKLRKQT